MNSLELKLARMRAGYTQEQAANALGIVLMSYANKERGRTKISLEESVVMADLFGLTATEYVKVFLDNHIFAHVLRN